MKYAWEVHANKHSAYQLILLYLIYSWDGIYFLTFLMQKESIYDTLLLGYTETTFLTLDFFFFVNY